MMKELSENAECADDLAHIEAGAKPALLQHSPEPAFGYHIYIYIYIY